MPLSQSRKKANRRWDDANRDRYWVCYLRFPAADKEVIFDRASELGIPVSEYLRNLVYTDLSTRQS